MVSELRSLTFFSFLSPFVTNPSRHNEICAEPTPLFARFPYLDNGSGVANRDNGHAKRKRNKKEGGGHYACV